MQDFYNRLNQFLIEVGLERPSTIIGCSENEIALQEQIYGVQFPLAYRLFLKWCGRRKPALFSQDYELRFLNSYWDSARNLLTENQAALEPGGFVFTEWQGYNFFYFLLGLDNPVVKLCIIKSETETGLDFIDYGCFTNWLINSIKSSVKTLQNIRRVHVDVPFVLSELDQIAQLASRV